MRKALKNKEKINLRLPPDSDDFDKIFGYFWNHGVGNRFDTDGDPQPWTPELLEGACENAGKPVDRRTIQNWRSGKNKPTRRNMHVLAKVASGGEERRRQAWADRFIAALDIVSDETKHAIHLQTPSRSPTTAQIAEPEPITSERPTFPKFPLALLGGVLAVSLAVILFRPTSLSPAAEEPMRVAVLPFENLSATPSKTYISAGMTDDIIQSLTQVPDLYVTPRRNSRNLSRKDLSMEEIGKALDVGFVLDGTVRIDDGRMKLNAGLYHIKSGEYVWSGQFDDPTDDIFSIQQDVADGVTDALNIVMSPDERAHMFDFGTENVEAYRQYLKGRHLTKFWHETHEGDDIWRGGEAFEAAVAADPKMARAWVHMTDLYYHFAARDIGPPATPLNVTVPSSPQDAIKRMNFVLDKGEQYGDPTTALQAKANHIFFSDNWTGLRPAVLNYAETVTPQRGELEWLYVPIMLSLLGETDAQTRLMDDRVLKYDPGNGTGQAYVVRQYLTQGLQDLAEERLSAARASSFSNRLSEVKGYMLVAEQDGRGLQTFLKTDKDHLSPLLTDYFTVLTHYFNSEPNEAAAALQASTALRHDKVHQALAAHHMGDRAMAERLFGEISSDPIGAVQIAAQLAYGAACGPNQLPPIPPLEKRMAEAKMAQLPCIGMSASAQRTESAGK